MRGIVTSTFFFIFLRKDSSRVTHTLHTLMVVFFSQRFPNFELWYGYQLALSFSSFRILLVSLNVSQSSSHSGTRPRGRILLDDYSEA